MNDYTTVIFPDGKEWKFRGDLARALRKRFDETRPVQDEVTRLRNAVNDTMNETNEILDDAATAKRR